MAQKMLSSSVCSTAAMLVGAQAGDCLSGQETRQQNRPVAVVAWINGRLKDLPYADRKSFWHVRARDLVNPQVVAKANLKSSSVCERSERTTGD